MFSLDLCSLLTRFCNQSLKLTLGINPSVDCRFNHSWVVDLNHCFCMLFMTPMKPANNLASSRAASFFSVFFLLLFSTPEAAILRQHGSRPGLTGSGKRLHAPGTLGLLFTTH